MQTIRPQQLTDEELLRQVYLMGNDLLPKEWVEELCTRLAKAIDRESDGCPNCSDSRDEGFEEGFAAGVEHANEFPKAQ
jgi:hypothetical protein